MAGNAIIWIFREQALKFTIVLCSWPDTGGLLPWRYVLWNIFYMCQLVLGYCSYQYPHSLVFLSGTASNIVTYIARYVNLCSSRF